MCTSSYSSSSSSSTPQPQYSDPTTIPFILNQRLTPLRKKQLIKAASRSILDPPPPPALGECCGSSCDPCVNDLRNQEKQAWLQRWGENAIQSVTTPTITIKDSTKDEEEKPFKMPGSFDW